MQDLWNSAVGRNFNSEIKSDDVPLTKEKTKTGDQKIYS